MYIMELKDLLTELRVYLGETLVREKLTPAVEEQRIRLLAKLNQISPPPNSYYSTPAYIDMTRAATLPSLSTIGKTEPTTYQAMSEPGASPSAHIKSGRLGRRERFLWMWQIRKWWAVLSSSAVLTLYSGPNESRVLGSVTLENYQARPVAQQGKTSTVFELFSPGNKTYQFIASDQEDMESWMSAFNDVCSKRRLPNPPSPAPTPAGKSAQEDQAWYDIPNSRVRPVTPITPSKQEYEQMDSFYHVISENEFKPQEQLYKNIGQHDEDNCYYNLLPRCSEEIYQTIMEAEKASPGAGQAVQAIVKAIEAAIAESQLYEPVETGHESER